MTRPNFKKRHQARYRAIQTLYQIHIAQHDALLALNEYEKEFNPSQVDMDYFRELVLKCNELKPELDQYCAPFLSRKLDEITPIELCVLRLATYELYHRLDIPYPVVLNEAIELTKIFGTVEGYKFINGVLDKMAPLARPNEPSKKQ